MLPQQASGYQECASAGMRAFSRAVSRFLEGLGSALGFTRRQYGHCILTGDSPNGIYGISTLRAETYSALILAARTTLPHFSISNAICLPNSSGVLPTIPKPRAAIRSIISGDFIISTL